MSLGFTPATPSPHACNRSPIPICVQFSVDSTELGQCLCIKDWTMTRTKPLSSAELPGASAEMVYGPGGEFAVRTNWIPTSVLECYSHKTTSCSMKIKTLATTGPALLPRRITTARTGPCRDDISLSEFLSLPLLCIVLRIILIHEWNRQMGRGSVPESPDKDSRW